MNEVLFDRFFQNLKINPTVKLARIWVIKSKNPIRLFENIEIPTVPKINKGPELFVNASNLSLSTLFRYPFSFKFETIFAPVG